MTARHELPTVLVVVPTLGERPELTARTFDSLDAQGGVSLSVAVVVQELTPAVTAECAKRGYALVLQTGRGMSNAINQGWLSHGDSSEFWAWLGDDDVLSPDSLLHATDCLRRRPRAVMVYGRCRYIDAADNLIFESRPGSLAAWLLRWGPNLVPQPGSLARGSAVRAVGMLDESLRYSMDLDLFIRLQSRGGLNYLPVDLAAFRWHEGSTTVSDLSASEREARAVRARTWVGWRRVGVLLEPAAQLFGRLLHRLQKRVP